ILNAYGKTTARWQLDPARLAGDSTTLAGLAWSFYRAGVRGQADSSASRVAAQLLDKKHSTLTRLGAATYFARGATSFENYSSELIRSARTDPSPDVRMAAVSSLGKIQSDSALAALKSIVKDKGDSRVTVNAIRALGAFPYRKIKNYLYEASTGRDVNVAVAASETILARIDPEDWIEVSTLTNQADDWRVKANLYEAALDAGKNKDVEKEIESKYEGASNPYIKAAYLSCLKGYPPAFEFVKGELQTANTAIVRTAAAGALAGMSKGEEVSSGRRKQFALAFRVLISSNDPAVVAIIASALADKESGYKALIGTADFLHAAKDRLRLPRDNEALQAVEEALAVFEGKNQPAKVINEFNHPIDWNLVKSIPSDQRATIKTARGSIVIRLLVDESPGSVANFIDLAQKNYFDNKFFHRVVPNFVVQAGCPRGDGWGSEDYSIRSEFSSRLFRTGSVGMASAGKDTEGTQWFITHSPTPHLDGRYTIFAEVVEGINVMDYLQVGDQILDVVVDRPPVQ
ncbi:MAG TPA: peptidylprolyl isomerase, partial [Chryseosolibacter sp.]